MKGKIISAVIGLGVVVAGMSILTACNTVQGTATGMKKDVQSVTGTGHEHEHAEHHHKAMGAKKAEGANKSGITRHRHKAAMAPTASTASDTSNNAMTQQNTSTDASATQQNATDNSAPKAQ